MVIVVAPGEKDWQLEARKTLFTICSPLDYLPFKRESMCDFLLFFFLLLKKF